MHEAPTNLLLAMVPSVSRPSLMRTLKPVALPRGAVVYEPQQQPAYVHFITAGIASIVTTMESGKSPAVGLVGREGMAESLHILGSAHIATRCSMQIAGTALRMRFDLFERLFFRDQAVRLAVLHYVQSQAIVLSQMTACNRLHALEQRLPRWLLMVADRVEDPNLWLTQGTLAQMMGTQRVTLNHLAVTLHRTGLIDSRRGHIRILDRQGLEALACECYMVSRDALAGSSAAPLPTAALTEDSSRITRSFASGDLSQPGRMYGTLAHIHTGLVQDFPS